MRLSLPQAGLCRTQGRRVAKNPRLREYRLEPARGHSWASILPKADNDFDNGFFELLKEGIIEVWEDNRGNQRYYPGPNAQPESVSWRGDAETGSN